MRVASGQGELNICSTCHLPVATWATRQPLFRGCGRINEYDRSSGNMARTRAAKLAHVRDLFRELIARDMKLRYKRSVMGVAWTLLNPLAELVILFLIFGLVLPLDIPNYPAFLFIGIFAYGWFQNSLYFATGAIVGNRELVRQPGFPVLILPVVTVASNLIHFLLALPILFALLLYSGIRPSWALARFR